jgi:4-amino-4-deoxy-L-arabinose transferase-like glycosyltransferase
VLINLYIKFSDSAEFADIARNLISGRGYDTTFSFFLKPLFTGMWIPPVMPLSIAAFFKIFGVSDFAVIATSFFFFLLSLIFVFLLAKKIFRSNLVGILSTLAVGFNYDLIHYATSGASESPFIFEIVAATYFVSLKKRWATIISFSLLVLSYFTRPQAFIYIAGIILYMLLINLKSMKALAYFVGILIAGLLVDKFVLGPLSGKYFLYSILGKGSTVLSQVGVGQSASDQLRSGALTYGFSVAESLKKVFYNLYNFYKLLPQIINPYLFALFAIGIFRWTKDKVQNSLKVASVFMVLITFLVTAASIPFFRYIHPVVPLVYIIAVGTLVEVISNFQFPISNQFSIFNLKISKKSFIILASFFIILIFGVGQSLGIIFLDSRFERNTHNVGKPPVYVVLSQILKTNTNPNQVVITNLDTWGSWYGERKTVWFPLMPKQLIDPATGEIPFDAIYLTSYLIDDQNYYMGADWRLIYNNPDNAKKWVCDGCLEISKEFTLKGVYSVPASDDYERQDAKAVLLIKDQ